MCSITRKKVSESGKHHHVQYNKEESVRVRARENYHHVQYNKEESVRVRKTIIMCSITRKKVSESGKLSSCAV